MMYVSQITMLHTLNLYSAVYKLYLNKTGKKKQKKNKGDNSIKKKSLGIRESFHLKTIRMIIS